MDLTNKSVRDLEDIIIGRSGLALSDDDWLEIDKWIKTFLKSDAPEEEKKKCRGLGLGEPVGIICDGITRWRKSICVKCKHVRNVKNLKKSECEVRGKTIPGELWINEDAQCQYFERL